MIDKETGRFVLGEGKKVYPGMNLTDFKETVLFEEELMDEKDKTEENEYIYRLKLQNIDGFKLRVSLIFDFDNFLKYIEIEKSDWRVPEKGPVEEKVGRGNNFEYEYSVLNYLHKFLAKQLEGSVEDGRELWFDYEWGEIRTVFTPYGATSSPADIKLVIKYRTRLFKPDDGDNRTLEELMGWE